MDIQAIMPAKKNPNIADFRVGDTVKVAVKVKEGDRERTQLFQGDVIRKRGGGAGESFTVRRVSHGVGVERIFMVSSPGLESVEVVRRGDVARAKLYYLRGRSGKAARIKEEGRQRKE